MNAPKEPQKIPDITLGFTMAVGMLFFTLIGVTIDKKRGGGYIATLAGMFAGLFFCGYEVWKIIRDKSND